jgi:hypothetical protein
VRILLQEYSVLKVLPFGRASSKWNPNGFHAIASIFLCLELSVLAFRVVAVLDTVGYTHGL